MSWCVFEVCLSSVYKENLKLVWVIHLHFLLSVIQTCFKLATISSVFILSCIWHMSWHAYRLLYQNAFLSKLKLFWDSLLLYFECESTIHLITLVCIYTSIFLKQDQIFFLKIALKHLLYVIAILDDFANFSAYLYEFWWNENHFDEIHRIIEWLRLEETLTIIWFHTFYLGQGCYPLDQADQFNLALTSFRDGASTSSLQPIPPSEKRIFF